MTNVEIRLLGRATADAAPAELWAETVSVDADRVTVTPVLPNGHEEDELTLRLVPASSPVRFALAQPADQEGGEPSGFTPDAVAGAGTERQRPYRPGLMLLLWPSVP